MADRITIDISILQGIFGDLNKLQQQLVGVSGGAMAVDNAASKGFGGMRTAVTGATTAVNGLDRSVDASMRNIVGDIMAPIAKTQELENKLRTLGDQVRTSKSVREIVALKREITATQRELDGVNPSGMEQKVSGSASRMRGMFSSLVAPLAGAFAIGGVTSFANGVVDAAAKSQAFSTSMEVMLKSKERANALTAQVTEFAGSTPFELGELRNATTQLLAYQVSADQIIPTLEGLGNIAAGVGREKLPQLMTAFGQVKAAGKLTGGELRQFTEAGVPLLDELAKITGQSTESMAGNIAKLDIPFNIVQQALRNLSTGNGQFANLMKMQSATIGGQLSNASDSWNKFKEDIGIALAPRIMSGIDMLRGGIDTLRGGFQWLQDNGPLVKGVLVAVGAGLGIYTAALAINSAATFVNTLAQGGAVAALGLTATWTTLTTAATNIAAAAQWAWNAALSANPIGLVVVAIAGLVAGIVWAWNNFEGFRGVVMGVWEVMRSAFNWIAEKAQPIIAALAVYWEVWKISIISTWDSIVSFVKSVGEWLNVLWGGVKWFVDMVVDYWSGLAEMLIAPFRTAFNFIAQIPGMDKLIGKAKEVGGKVGEAFGRGQEEGVAGIRADNAKTGIDASIVAKPAQDIGAASLVGGSKSSKDSKTEGVTVGGDAKGSGRTITMDISITNNIAMPRDGNMGVRELAEKVTAAIVNKMNDAQFAMG